MTAAPVEPPMLEASSSPQRRFNNLRGVQWRIDLGILPSSPLALIDNLRRAAADSRRRYANLRRRNLIYPYLLKDENKSSDIAVDNPLSQNPDSTWGRFFRNAELEKTVNQDLSRLYPEDGSYFQTPPCQAMLRRILLLWSLEHPQYGYRQGMHELLAPLVYVLHGDLDHLSQVRRLHEDCFNGEFDGLTSPQGDMDFNYSFMKDRKWKSRTEKGSEAHENTPKLSTLDELDADTKQIFLLSDPYGAEGELGVILSERFMEHDAYSMFDGLMDGAGGMVAMADFFSPSPSGGTSTRLPPIIEASSALYHLLSAVDSSLHSHLVELGVEPQYFALRWLRVLFGREFCLTDLLVLWDGVFASSNIKCINNNEEYSFRVLCSSRGAFIAAMAVSMLLHLRSSLLAMETATSCLQKLLNFPTNIEMRKLIEKAKSLEAVALDANTSSCSLQTSSPVNRLSSLPSSSASSKASSHLFPDTYWEERWRVLHGSETLPTDKENDPSSSGLITKPLEQRTGLSRTESDPSPATIGIKKDSQSSVRRRLFSDLSRSVENMEAVDGSLQSDRAIASNEEPASMEVNIEKHSQEELADQNIKGRASNCTEETCLSTESSLVFSLERSPNNMDNDQENNSEKSSVTSNSFIGDNDESVLNTEVSCSHEYSREVVRDLGSTTTVKLEEDGPLENTLMPKVRKPLSSKFQWFWKLGRGSSEGSLENAGGEASRGPPSGDNKKDSSGSCALDGFSNSCGVTTRADGSDKKVVGTLKNLGQSMLENIQVIESAFQQDNNTHGGKGQVTAMSALTELRKISNLICQM